MTIRLTLEHPLSRGWARVRDLGLLDSAARRLTSVLCGAKACPGRHPAGEALADLSAEVRSSVTGGR